MENLSGKFFYFFIQLFWQVIFFVETQGEHFVKCSADLACSIGCCIKRIFDVDDVHVPQSVQNFAVVKW